MDKKNDSIANSKTEKKSKLFAVFGFLYIVCFLIFTWFYIRTNSWGYGGVIIVLGLLILAVISFILSLFGVLFGKRNTNDVLTIIALTLTIPGIIYAISMQGVQDLPWK